MMWRRSFPGEQSGYTGGMYIGLGTVILILLIVLLILWL